MTSADNNPRSRFRSKRLVFFFVAMLIPLVISAGEYAWPKGSSKSSLWPEDKNAVKILDEKFAQASTNALGTAADVANIKDSILAQKVVDRIDEIRWVSSSALIARASTQLSVYYYVVEKKKGKWEVIAYYLLCII